ncbi:PIN domain-containing protein [Kitasatospora sp. NPDC058965]|uniref:PIN domain-containing protein n=1 Tax=Kitasatospora sp. NPDC058965 TaxID=3346682 RepID=UPI003677869A
MQGSDASVRPPRGIFDCDEAHQSPLQDDYKRIFETGMVVLDANVLLNLYRSNEQTRLDTLAVLKKLQERLWIPYQVLVEFWRNREQSSIRHHHRSKAKEAQAALEKVPRSARDALERWAAAVHLKSNAEVSEQIDQVIEKLTLAIDEAKNLIETQAETDSLQGTASTDTDPVLADLRPLLEGRVGEPLSPEDHAKAVQEAQRRADDEVPPGYEDFKTKSAEQAAGDYILWAQLLDAAASKGCDVLLVTGDAKEDWWNLRNGDIPARPRMELVAEMRHHAGVRLFMLSPGDLLTWADQILDLQVKEASVNDLNQLRAVEAEAESTAAGWTVESIQNFLKQLAGRYQVQAKVVVAAAANNGFVDRATVYELAGYPADRQLKGFTRPLSTIAKELQEWGTLTGEEPFLLQTVYGSEAEPSLASGFRVPDETVPLIREVFEGTALWPTPRRSESGPGKTALKIAMALLPANASEWTAEVLGKAAENASAAMSATGQEVSADHLLRELESLAAMLTTRKA